MIAIFWLLACFLALGGAAVCIQSEANSCSNDYTSPAPVAAQEEDVHTLVQSHTELARIKASRVISKTVQSDVDAKLLGNASLLKADRDQNKVNDVTDKSDVDGARDAVVLNEVLANPSSGNEWVEIYNRGARTVDVTHWRVVDKAGYTGTWSGTKLSPHSHLVVEFKGKLNNGKELIELGDPSDFIVDVKSYSSTKRGKSLARIPDGCSWDKELQNEPTKGYANPASVVINEVLAHPRTGLEWVELYNPSHCDAYVSGWSLKDEKGYSSKPFPSSTVAAQSYLIVSFSGKLNNNGDTVTLFDSRGQQIDKFKYTKADRDRSWTRIPDGCSWNKELQSKPTKGYANPASVVINEVMAHPLTGLEWVELYNPSHCDVYVSGWSLKDKKGYPSQPFPAKTVAAQSYLVVSFSGKLNNNGDTVTLFGGRGQQIDKFEYTNADRDRSWIRAPDGGPWIKAPQISSKGLPNPSVSSPTEAPVPPNPFGRGCGACSDGLCFGTWNIQNLGNAKNGRPAVIAIIKQVLARYDLAEIQELSQKPKPPYVCGDNTESVICAARPSLDFTVYASPRIGDEQYVVMARNSVVKQSGTGATYPDPNGIHARSPHAFEFEVTAGGQRPWELVVAGTHTRPTKARAEIKNFQNVMAWMKQKFPKRAGRQYLLAGDFNADGSYFNDEKGFPSSTLPGWEGYTLLTPNELDTTVSTNDHTYDRIIVDSEMATTAGVAEVFSFDRIDLSGIRDEGCRLGYVPSWVCAAQYNTGWAGLPQKVKTALAKEVSDHYPVEVCLQR